MQSRRGDCVLLGSHSPSPPGLLFPRPRREKGQAHPPQVPWAHRAYQVRGRVGPMNPQTLALQVAVKKPRSFQFRDSSQQGHLSLKIRQAEARSSPAAAPKPQWECGAKTTVPGTGGRRAPTPSGLPCSLSLRPARLFPVPCSLQKAAYPPHLSPCISNPRPREGVKTHTSLKTYTRFL